MENEKDIIGKIQRKKEGKKKNTEQNMNHPFSSPEVG
jgi:hypothetical protein